MSIQKIWVVIIFIGLLFITSASADNARNSTVTNISGSAYHTDQHYHPQQGYWNYIDNLPLGTHYVGDSFTVSGETNLPVGQEIQFLAQISNLGPGSPTTRPPSETGSTIVTTGTGEVHTWSFVIDTTKFTKDTGIRSEAIAGDYILIIGPFNPDTYPFTLVNKTRASPESPTQIASASPTPQSASQPTTSRKSSLPTIVWILPREELITKVSTVHFVSSKDFTDYINAPSITGIQKIDALMIASTSMQNTPPSSTASVGAIHKKFGDYLKSSHGPIAIEWAYPYTGDIYLSMPVGSLSSNEYGLAYATVNIDNR